MSTRLRAAALGLGLGLVITPALSGCIPSIDDVVGGLVGQGVQSGLEDLTGINVSEGQLPEGFPSEVPVVEGEILGGATAEPEAGTRGWVVSIATTRTAEDVQSQLEHAGFTSPDGADGLGFIEQGLIIAENERYNVAAVVAEDGDRRIANYTVTQK